MNTIFRKVAIEDRLPELNKFVVLIDEAGEMIIYRRTDLGWQMRESNGINTPNNNLKLVYWLEEVEVPKNSDITLAECDVYEEYSEKGYAYAGGLFSKGARWMRDKITNII